MDDDTQIAIQNMSDAFYPSQEVGDIGIEQRKLKGEPLRAIDCLLDIAIAMKQISVTLSLMEMKGRE